MFKKNRIIVYVTFGLLHLSVFIFSLYIDKYSEDILFLIRLQRLIWLFKFVSATFIAILFYIIFMNLRDNWKNLKNYDLLRHQINSLKAKLYDIEHQTKTTTTEEPKKVS